MSADHVINRPNGHQKAFSLTGFCCVFLLFVTDGIICLCDGRLCLSACQCLLPRVSRWHSSFGILQRLCYWFSHHLMTWKVLLSMSAYHVHQRALRASKSPFIHLFLLCASTVVRKKRVILRMNEKVTDVLTRLTEVRLWLSTFERLPPCMRGWRLRLWRTGDSDWRSSHIYIFFLLLALN